MRNFLLSILVLLSVSLLYAGDPPQVPDEVIIGKLDKSKGPRSLTEVVAYAHVGANSVEVSFMAPMGEVTLYLTGESGVVDMAVVDSATENATLLLDDTTSGNYTITLVDALGNEYSGAFSR